MTVQARLDQLVVARLSDRGLKRAVNEDYCDFRVPASGSPEAAYGALFAVADGVGGMGSGQHASRAAIETLLDSYYDPELDDEDPRERIVAAIQDAHESVLARIRAFDGRSIGTTLVGVVVLASGRTFTFNVGDSRVYRLRGDGIDQLTADHSAVDPAAGQGGNAKLTAYVGQPRPIVPHVKEQDFAPGDTLVICSDGLWGLVEPDKIAAVVRAMPPENAVKRLVEQVYANGARDNVTVMIVRYGAARRQRRLWVALLLVVVLAVAGGVALFVSQQNAAPAGLAEATVTVLDETEPAATETVTAGVDTIGHLTVRTPTPGPR